MTKKKRSLFAFIIIGMVLLGVVWATYSTHFTKDNDIPKIGETPSVLAPDNPKATVKMSDINLLEWSENSDDVGLQMENDDTLVRNHKTGELITLGERRRRETDAMKPRNRTAEEIERAQINVYKSLGSVIRKKEITKEELEKVKKTHKVDYRILLAESKLTHEERIENRRKIDSKVYVDWGYPEEEFLFEVLRRVMVKHLRNRYRNAQNEIDKKMIFHDADNGGISHSEITAKNPVVLPKKNPVVKEPENVAELYDNEVCLTEIIKSNDQDLAFLKSIDMPNESVINKIKELEKQQKELKQDLEKSGLGKVTKIDTPKDTIPARTTTPEEIQLVRVFLARKIKCWVYLTDAKQLLAREWKRRELAQLFIQEGYLPDLFSMNQLRNAILTQLRTEYKTARSDFYRRILFAQAEFVGIDQQALLTTENIKPTQQETHKKIVEVTEDDKKAASCVIFYEEQLVLLKRLANPSEIERKYAKQLEAELNRHKQAFQH